MNIRRIRRRVEIAGTPCLLANASEYQAFKYRWCGDIDCGKTPENGAEENETRSRYSIGEWYGRAFEFLSPKHRRDQAKLHAGLTTIAGFDCPFQKNRTCNKKGGVCSLRRYEQIDDGPVKGIGPLVTTCPNRFLEDDTIFLVDH